MSIDHRLHHAARELRELPIETPPLETIRRRRDPARMVHALAAPLLFAAAGLFAYGAVQPGPTSVVDTDRPGVSTPPPYAPSVEAERELIAVLRERGAARPSTPIDDAPAEAPNAPVFGSVRPV